jgi:hypothetical protein
MGMKQLSLVKIVGLNLPKIEIKSFKNFSHTIPFPKVPHKTKSKKNKLLKMKVLECLVLNNESKYREYLLTFNYISTIG